jgi:putative Holliday junction resolvase
MLSIQEINIIKYKIKMLDIKDFKKKLDKKSRLMGIDPGKKRIGIAISDENKAVATPYKVLTKDSYSAFVEEIKKIIDDNGIKGVIIGNPINMDGTPSESSQSAKDMAINLSKNISEPIAMWDERLSSHGAFNLVSNLDINTSKKLKKLDQNAAAFILQGALDYLKK